MGLFDNSEVNENTGGRVLEVRFSDTSTILRKTGILEVVS